MMFSAHGSEGAPHGEEHADFTPTISGRTIYGRRHVLGITAGGGIDTVRRILLASAAVPGAFPPTMIEVTLNGAKYQEMHVDGGAFTQAFLNPSSMTQERRDRLRRRLPVVPVSAFIIRNGRVDPGWTTVQRRTLGIAGRAISTMIGSSGEKRPDPNLRNLPPRRRRLQTRLHRNGLHDEVARAVRPRLHARFVRLRLTTSPPWLDWKRTPPEF